MLRRKAIDAGPTPLEIAAYADGELRGSAHARVAAWLAAHPETSAEVDEIRRLDYLCKTGGPADPGEAAWQNVWQRVEQAAAAQAPRTRWWQRLGRMAVPLGSAAAALLVAVLLRPDAPPPIDPYPVVRADEVDIISYADADWRTVLVGQLPLSEPIVLGRPDDMSDLDIRPDTDGMVPTVRPIEGSSVVIVAPLGWSGADDKDEP